MKTTATILWAVLSLLCFTAPATGMELATMVSFSLPGGGQTLPLQLATIDPVEIKYYRLSAREGWVERNDNFRVWMLQEAGTVPVCQFVGQAELGDATYFYTANQGECALLQKGEFWKLVTPSAFFVKLPQDETGGCEAGTVPVIRYYNQGSGGTPNHFYLSSEWKVLVHFGTPEGVAWCSPSTRR